MSRSAASWNPAHSTLHHPVVWIRRNRSVRIQRGCAWHILIGIKIESLLLIVIHGAIQAHAYTKIQRQPWSYVPVILKIRFKYFVPQIVLGLPAGLSKALYISCQQVGERVPS